MSFREEDREKNNCPSSGLGLAAAAIGVGVGAALYYFFSKREEQPHSEGASGSSTNWAYENHDNLTDLKNRRNSRDHAFRQRAWSLEECSICFDIILVDQQVRTLPCTHRFHSTCITPWLQEKQTCPNCRKATH